MGKNSDFKKKKLRKLHQIIFFANLCFIFRSERSLWQRCGQDSWCNQLCFVVAHILYFTLSVAVSFFELIGQKAYHDGHIALIDDI